MDVPFYNVNWPVAFAWGGNVPAIPGSCSCGGTDRLRIKSREVSSNELLESDM